MCHCFVETADQAGPPLNRACSRWMNKSLSARGHPLSHLNPWVLGGVEEIRVFLGIAEPRVSGRGKHNRRMRYPCDKALAGSDSWPINPPQGARQSPPFPRRHPCPKTFCHPAILASCRPATRSPCTSAPLPPHILVPCILREANDDEQWEWGGVASGAVVPGARLPRGYCCHTGRRTRRT